MSRYILLFIWLIIVNWSCRTKERCDKMSNHFVSYDQAISEIESSTFKIQEEANTSKSSWIRGASFYSCDGNNGFFILETDTQEYIYSNMPYKVWMEFKNAESLGKYYNERISLIRKGRFPLRSKPATSFQRWKQFLNLRY